MCGIVGIVALDGHPLDPRAIEPMRDTLAHRGPDGAGSFVEGPVALGHRRLSIIDIAGGDQPMATQDGSIRCVFNGEIYNYIELRRALQASGCRFVTESDTETILHAYVRSGDRFVDDLRGMFAIALWDERGRRLVLARDRIGKKPLYYTVTATHVAFASELKALLRWPGLDDQVDVGAIRDYLRFTYVPAPRSILANVHKLLPGHRLIVDVERAATRVERYWRFDLDPGERDPAGHADELRSLLEESVSLRLRSDVPVGALLSGGLDSSAVTVLAARALQPNRLSTFSVAFPDPRFNEAHFADLVASSVGTRHTEQMALPSTPEVLHRVAWFLDEPFADSSAVSTYVLCERARTQLKVVLSGDGGDELFAGYQRYRDHRRIARIGALPPGLRRVLRDRLASLERGLRLLPSWRQRIRRAGKALDASLLPDRERPFFLNQVFGAGESESLLALGVRDDLKVPRFEEAWTDAFDPSRNLSDLELFLYLDTVLGLPDDMLTKIDRMSMAHGLEVRCPLLDQDVVAFAARLPMSEKLPRRGLGKALLRDALGVVVPPSVLTRPKQGFAGPVGDWMAGPFRELVADCLSSESVERRGWLDPAAVAAVREDVLRTGPDRPARSDYQRWHRAWAVLMLEMWARTVFDDRRSVPPVAAI